MGTKKETQRLQVSLYAKEDAGLSEKVLGADQDKDRSRKMGGEMLCCATTSYKTSLTP
jgi:hypothetical protein